MPDPTPTGSNFPTGHQGLVAVDKIGNKVLFLDPVTYVTVATLEGFTPRVHELEISPDGLSAYVPIYGDGKHGDNPHPGHWIAVIDLQRRKHSRTISTAPYLAPHCMRWGPAGQLYCLCENSAVVLELHAQTGQVLHVIEVGSSNAHRMELLPDGSKLYTENEEDASVTVVDLLTRQRIKTVTLPSAVDGIGMSPDGQVIVLVDAQQPRIFVLDTRTDEIIQTLPLSGHSKPAQIARYSPNGQYLVVTNHDEPLATIFTADLAAQKLVRLGKGPMDMAYHEDGRTVLIANHDAGTLCVVDLPSAQVLRTVTCGTGVETLAFF